MFGGKVIALGETNSYSGLYSYNIKDKKWNLLRSDSENNIKGGCTLKSRIGHAMALYKPKKLLFIFSGQRNEHYLSDFLVYDIEKDIVLEMAKDTSRYGGPVPSFTMRVNIDPYTNELFLASGREHDYVSSQNSMQNSFWTYDIIGKFWNRVYLNKNISSSYWERMKMKEPSPRFAHQVVYDYNERVFI